MFVVPIGKQMGEQKIGRILTKVLMWIELKP